MSELKALIAQCAHGKRRGEPNPVWVVTILVDPCAQYLYAISELIRTKCEVPYASESF